MTGNSALGLALVLKTFNRVGTKSMFSDLKLTCMKQTMYIACLTTFPVCQSGVDKLYISTKRQPNWQLSSADLDVSIAYISHATTRQIASRYMYGKTALLIMPHDKGKGSVPTSKFVTFSGDVKTVVFFFFSSKLIFVLEFAPPDLCL